MVHLKILKHQLHLNLPLNKIELIAKETGRYNVKCFGFSGGTYNGIIQSPDQCLVVYLNDSDNPSVSSLSVPVPLKKTICESMLNNSTSSSRDLEIALDSCDQYTVGCHLINQTNQKGISLTKIVRRFQQMVDTKVVSAFLIIKKGNPERYFITDIFIGDRLEATDEY